MSSRSADGARVYPTHRVRGLADRNIEALLREAGGLKALIADLESNPPREGARILRETGSAALKQ
jgi:hypothetical protein